MSAYFPGFSHVSRHNPIYSTGSICLRKRLELSFVVLYLAAGGRANRVFMLPCSGVAHQGLCLLLTVLDMDRRDVEFSTLKREQSEYLRVQSQRKMKTPRALHSSTVEQAWI